MHLLGSCTLCEHVRVCTITVYVFLPVYGPLELLAHNTVPQTGPPQGPSDSAHVCVCLLHPAGSTRSISRLLNGTAACACSHLTHAHNHTLYINISMHIYFFMQENSLIGDMQSRNVCACRNAYISH